MIKKLLSFLSIFACILSLVLQFALPASANFDQNLLIDDTTFNNANSMSLAEINSFLNQFPQSCISTNNGFTSPDPTGYSPSSGFTYGANVSGGQVIYDAAQAYGLNPQVLIATLEKESSVVTGDASYGCQYINTAAGYGCPDSGSCPTDPATESGFSKQVIHAAWLFKFGEERSEGNAGWDVQHTNFPQQGDVWDNSDDPNTCYGGPMTQGTFQVCPGGSSTYYDGYTTIDGSSVYMGSGATASLYWYTPHFPGNENFVTIFNEWFGSTISECEGISSTDNGVMRLINPKSGGQFLTQSTSEACSAVLSGFLYDGQMFIPNNVTQTIPVYRLDQNGNFLYTASASESAHSGFTYDGVAFFAVDPTTDTNAVPVYRLSSKTGAFLYTVSTAEKSLLVQEGYNLNGISFYVDQNSGNTASPVYRLSNQKGEFLYTNASSEINSAEGEYGYTMNGISFNALNMFSLTDIPIYRLHSAKGYLLTTSLPERLGAYQAGFTNDGATMFTYPTNSNTMTTIYRLSNSSGNFLYTGSTSELNNAVQGGYSLNGVSFYTPD